MDGSYDLIRTHGRACFDDKNRTMKLTPYIQTKFRQINANEFHKREGTHHICKPISYVYEKIWSFVLAWRVAPHLPYIGARYQQLRTDELEGHTPYTQKSDSCNAFAHVTTLENRRRISTHFTQPSTMSRLRANRTSSSRGRHKQSLFGVLMVTLGLSATVSPVGAQRRACLGQLTGVWSVCEQSVDLAYQQADPCFSDPEESVDTQACCEQFESLVANEW